MKTSLVLTLIGLIAMSGTCLARTMDRCSLAREMAKLGIPRDQLARWTCIAEHESGFRTGLVSPPHTDGSNNYGIFQLNDRYWCQAKDKLIPPSSNICDIACDDLLSDDIAKSVSCAQKVFSAMGFPAWSTWTYCNRNLPTIESCFESIPKHLK